MRSGLIDWAARVVGRLAIKIRFSEIRVTHIWSSDEQHKLMNLACISLGVLLGWCWLLLLPWALTRDPNPLNSVAGHILLVPLLIPVWLVGETGGGRCPKFLKARLEWIARNSNYAKLIFVAHGIAIGSTFAIGSAVVIILVMAFLPFVTPLIKAIIIVLAGLVHLALFLFSFALAIESVKNWGRKIYRNNKSQLKIAPRDKARKT